jgi:hypothetical protein
MATVDLKAARAARREMTKAEPALAAQLGKAGPAGGWDVIGARG